MLFPSFCRSLGIYIERESFLVGHHSHILRDPVVELGLELVVVDVHGRRGTLPPDVVLVLPLAEGELDGGAAGDGVEVVEMREDVEAEGDGVAAEGLDAVADLDVARRVVGREGVAVGQPVLRRRVRVVEDDRGQARHRVVQVRHAQLVARLVRHVLRERRVAHARAAVVDDVHRQARLARVRGAQRAHGRAERVAREDDLVARVRRLRRPHRVQGRVRDLVPRLGEAGVHLAARAEAAVVLEELETVGVHLMLVSLCYAGLSWSKVLDMREGLLCDLLCDPVTDRVGSSDGQDNDLVGRIRGDESPNIGCRTPIEACESHLSTFGIQENQWRQNVRESGLDGRASGGNIWAGAAGASHDGTDGGVTVAVRCTSVLCVEPEGVQLGIRDRR